VKTLKSLLCVIAVAVLTLSMPVDAAIQLTQIVSGLSSPLFVGHAGDGSGRLFIVERGGVIKVLQPGSTTPTVFLNITSRVQSGGEQGLLGLAFHPLYESNGRFFVFYTRSGGEIVVAEYGVSVNPNVADPAEEILLTIPHPSATNHNGGMLAFGPDTYLYIGVGDGGGANDPQDNAQNLNVLLGKILRIDIDVPDGETYVSPPSNPFVGMADARGEIFAYGMRNPWRLSFDRALGDLSVADVGQGAREEVNTPIVAGGNYGWRIWEGFACTNNDPALCGSQAGYIFPVFDYGHTGGRCSITGGYVYRGSQGALADGTYVYGDYCTGEIFGWTGGSPSVLLDTALNISSFGEDESGELYVVGLGGTISKIVSAAPPPPPPPPPPPASCTYAISPARVNFSSTGGTGSVTVTTAAGCNWTATTGDTWITVTGGASGSGPGAVTYSVAPYSGRQGTRNGRVTIAGQVFTVKQSR
jgi:Glucose / Sorbosone dehydrogenase